MKLFWALYLLDKISKNKKPVISDEKCLNNRQNIVNCTSCQRFCPSGAIKCGEKILVDDSMCKSCGTCSTSCPAKCIKWPYVNWYTRYNEVMTAEIPVIGCGKSELSPVNVYLPCIGCIDWEFISAVVIGSGGSKNIFIDISECFSCSLKKSLRQFMKSLRKSTIFTGNNTIKLIFPGTEKFDIPNADPGVENMRFFGGRVREFAGSIVNDILPAGEDIPGSVKIPEQRELLKICLEQTNNQHLKLNAWNVNDNCKACGFCQGICPQRAWDFVYEKEIVNLVHNPWVCSECGLCALICKEKAKEKTRCNASMFFNNNNEWISRVFKYTACKNCSQPVIITKDKGEICNSCLKREDLINDFRKQVV